MHWERGVTAWAGPAFVRRAVREERGQIYSASEVLEITNQYNENDGVSKRVHELAFVIVNCFGSAEFLHISTTLYIGHHMHQHLPPLSSSPIAPVDLPAFLAGAFPAGK